MIDTIQKPVNSKKLKAVKPSPVEKRLKLLVYGPPGVGKTTAALQFPNSYIIDTEKGTDFYSKTINKNDSAVIQTSNVDDIKDELQTLLTTPHEYKTLVIDPITQVYNSCQEKWTRIFEKHATNEKASETQDFGPRFWGRVKQDMKTIDRLSLALDMNVIWTSHQKDIYGPGMTKLGVGPDAKKGDEYLFDLVFELKEINGKRLAITKKERAEIGEQKFPSEFEWSYGNFLNLYGKEVISRSSNPTTLATSRDVEELKKLLEIVNIGDAIVTKWLTKANVDTFEEMTEAQIKSCVNFCRKKLGDLSKEDA